MPIKFKDPTGKIAFVPIVIFGGGAISAEGLLHLYLASRANSLPWSDADGKGRKRHCYVNCMSTRIHLGGTGPVTLAGLGQEFINAGQYWWNGSFRDGIADSWGDLQANANGQGLAFMFWKSCFELCDTCQVPQ